MRTPAPDTPGPPERVSSLEQQLRTSRRDAADAASQLRRAREEADELRAAKEAAVVEREQGLIKAERGVKQLASEAAEARGMSEGLARKARHLQVRRPRAHWVRHD